MLTVKYFKEDLPDKILVQSDYFKLVAFLKDWMAKAESPDHVFEFVKSLSKSEKKVIRLKLLTVLETFLKFEIKKANFIVDILKDNNDKLSEFTKAKLLEFGNLEFNRSGDILQILDSITTIFDDEEKE